MTKELFIHTLREMGFTEHFIDEVLLLREQERGQGILRDYKDYLPTNPDEIDEYRDFYANT